MKMRRHIRRASAAAGISVLLLVLLLVNASAAENGSISVSAAVGNQRLIYEINGAEEAAVTVLTAWYDASGRMLGVSRGSNGTAVVGGGADHYRAFFLDAETGAPLCAPWSGTASSFAVISTAGNEEHTPAYEVDGTTLTIKAGGVYTISGSLSEGNIVVKKNVTGATLILRDLTLQSSITAPIVCKKDSSTNLRIEGTVTLTDSEDASTEDVNSDFEGAAIKTKSGASLTIGGSGTLNLNGSAKRGIKGGGDVTIDGGIIQIDAVDDAINADGNLNLNGGTLMIRAGDDALHADGDLTIDGSNITVSSCYEGFEGARVFLKSGSGRIEYASDDGVNVASDDNRIQVTIQIDGGTWYINAEGDGLDAGGNNNPGNGTIVLTGGELEVFASKETVSSYNDMNGALDSESGITAKGGTVLAVGMSAMAEVPRTGTYLAFGGRGWGWSQLRYPNFVFPGGQLVIKDNAGNIVYAAKHLAARNANSVVFISDSLTKGADYQLFVNGQAVEKARAA